MNKKRIAKAMPCIVLLGASVLVSGCASATSKEASATTDDPKECVAKANEVCVNITFHDKCPKAVDLNPDLTQSKFIVWQAVENFDPKKPIDADYKIYFDPFTAGPKIEVKKGQKGRVKSPAINSKAPAGPNNPDAGDAVEYKYTIVSDSCVGNKPLDPRFFVRR